MAACYVSYITSACVNNLAALLFVTFSKQFGCSLEQLSFILTANFGVQFIVDFLGAKFADRIGYKPLLLTSQVFAAVGLVGLGIFPRIFPSAYAGILTAAFFYAIGSGLMEVIISPIIEALPGDAKASSMSLLHSFYCWGHVLTVVLSTLFMKFFGRENWSILCCLWAIIPICNFFFCRYVPVNQLGGENAERTKLRKLFGVKVMWVFIILMICSGAAELGMAQWSSFFAETELGVSKQTADLLGPCMFAITMGLSRIFYAAVGEKINIRTALLISSALCVISYLLAALAQHPYLSLAGCTLCGFSVGIMWPGVLSLASKTYSAGGTAMFAILALFGDVGCFIGPETVARASSFTPDGVPSVKTGLAYAVIFPVLITGAVGLLYLREIRKKHTNG